MSQEYKYPPDTSWLPTGGAAPGWQWGVVSIALSLVPFALLVIVGFSDDFRLALLSWFIGLIVGLRGLRGRGVAWPGRLPGSAC